MSKHMDLWNKGKYMMDQYGVLLCRQKKRTIGVDWTASKLLLKILHIKINIILFLSNETTDDNLTSKNITIETNSIEIHVPIKIN